MVFGGAKGHVAPLLGVGGGGHGPDASPPSTASVLVTVVAAGVAPPVTKALNSACQSRNKRSTKPAGLFDGRIDGEVSKGFCNKQ